MLRLSLALYILAIQPSFAQTMEEQEIQLPDYILSDPVASEELEEDKANKGFNLATSFKDELEELLKSEQEMLPKYHFKANIMVLNKNTNNIQNHLLEDGTIIIHRSLEINALNCLHNYNSLHNNDYIFLDILDRESKKSLYRGWMSARMPGLTPFNHPTYSIKALNCKVGDTIKKDEVLEEEQTLPIEETNEINSQKEAVEGGEPTLPTTIPNILQPLNLISQ